MWYPWHLLKLELSLEVLLLEMMMYDFYPIAVAPICTLLLFSPLVIHYLAVMVISGGKSCPPSIFLSLALPCVSIFVYSQLYRGVFC